MAKKRGWFFGGGKKTKQTKWFKNFRFFFFGGGGPRCLWLVRCISWKWVVVSERFIEENSS